LRAGTTAAGRAGAGGLPGERDVEIGRVAGEGEEGETSENDGDCAVPERISWRRFFGRGRGGGGRKWFSSRRSTSKSAVLDNRFWLGD
jgi:hypothetical protein